MAKNKTRSKAPRPTKDKPLEYTHFDVNGVKWRFLDGRPVSEIADKVISTMPTIKKVLKKAK